jgi:hypothetical protein
MFFPSISVNQNLLDAKNVILLSVHRNGADRAGASKKISGLSNPGT